MSDLVYLYGFVPATAPAPSGISGMAGRDVRLLPVTGAAAVTSEVPGDAYAAHAIEAKLEDLDWVAAQGAAHERVVSWFVDHTDIVPAALFTLYSTSAALEQDAAARAAAVQEALARLRGLREWDVKVYYDAAVLEAQLVSAAPALAALDAELADAAPGRRYLLDRKRTELVSQERKRVLHETAEALLDAVRPLAAAVVRTALPRAAADVPVVLQAALLVARDAEAELSRRFADAAASGEQLGIHAALSGPWAPYRFVDDPDGGMTGGDASAARRGET